MNIGWPEGIVLGLMGLNLFLTAVLDGEPRTGKHSSSSAMGGALISFGLLYWGGFFA